MRDERTLAGTQRLFTGSSASLVICSSYGTTDLLPLSSMAVPDLI
jgi:hypothetical protein